jgi:cold shock CspA family protein
VTEVKLDAFVSYANGTSNRSSKNGTRNRKVVKDGDKGPQAENVVPVA